MRLFRYKEYVDITITSDLIIMSPSQKNVANLLLKNLNQKNQALISDEKLNN